MNTTRFDSDAYARRIQYAILLLQLKAGRPITQKWIAEQVSKRLGIKPALRSASVSRWVNGESEPADAATTQALAEVLSVDPGWMVFGAASTAQAPYGGEALQLTTPAPTRRGATKRRARAGRPA